MPLTPEDVSKKRFTPVRLREGYDMGEVDQFLDEVEAELERLLKENDDLRSKVTAGGGAATTSVATAAPAASSADEKVADEPDEKAEKAPAAAAAPAARTVTPPPSEQIHVTTAAEASSAATRLLELATRNADEVVVEARAEAEQIVASARTDAERLDAETRSRTEKLDEDARGRAQRLDDETESRRREALGDIEKEKGRLDGEVENLRTFEREYRSRLKSYFSQQLAALDGDGPTGELTDGDAPAPKRLKSILGAGSEHVQGQASPANAAPEASGEPTPGEEQPRS